MGFRSFALLSLPFYSSRTETFTTPSSAIEEKVEIREDGADMINDRGDALQLAVMNFKTRQRYPVNN